jgi:uncharacterized repeat protein (TIGR01451 family)
MRTYRRIWMTVAILLAVLVAAAGVVGAARPAVDGLEFETLVIPPTSDTLLYEWEPDRNYAAEWRVFLRSDGVSTMLLSFDLSELPYDKNDLYVAEATLSLYSDLRTNESYMVASAVGVERPWIADEATWGQASDLTEWELGGCSGATDLTDVASEPVSIEETGAWIQFDVSEIVRGWVDGSLANHGIAIKSAPVSAVAYRVITVDHSSVEWRPKLRIVYAKVPTPPPALVVDKAGPAGPFYTGSQDLMEYTITVTNPGEEAVTGVMVMDVVPLGAEYVSSTEGGVYDEETSQVVWEAAGLGPAESWTAQVTCSLSPWVGTPGILVNVARAGCEECEEVREDTWVLSILRAPLRYMWLPLLYNP